jgi:hypothetical protein
VVTQRPIASPTTRGRSIGFGQGGLSGSEGKTAHSPAADSARWFQLLTRNGALLNVASRNVSRADASLSASSLPTVRWSVADTVFASHTRSRTRVRRRYRGDWLVYPRPAQAFDRVWKQVPRLIRGNVDARRQHLSRRPDTVDFEN